MCLALFFPFGFLSREGIMLSGSSCVSWIITLPLEKVWSLSSLPIPNILEKKSDWPGMGQVSVLDQSDVARLGREGVRQQRQSYFQRSGKFTVSLADNPMIQ